MEIDPTSRGHHHDSNKRQEPALNYEVLMVPGGGPRKYPGSECIQGPTIREKLNEMMAKKRAIGEQRIVSGFGINPTSLRNPSHSKDLQLPDPETKPNVIDSLNSRDHHDSNNGREPALDHDEVMMQSGVTENFPVQLISLGNDAGNEHQSFTLQKIPMNFPMSAGFLKQLSVSNFYRREGAEGGGRAACMVSF